MQKETALEKGRRIYQERRAAGEVKHDVTHNWIVKANRKPTSLQRAIYAMCFHCFGGTADSLPDPGWKNSIRCCTATDCPLHNHRPYRNVSVVLEDANDSDEDLTIDE